MNAAPESVLVVAVSYFGSGDVAGLVSSLQAGADGWRLVVVDNSCDGREHAALRGATADEPRVRVVVAESNLGYFGGARRGLVEVDPTTVAWTVVANTDLRFAPTFVERLVGVPDEAVIAPAILSETSGSDQNPYLEERPSRATVLRWRLQFATVPVARTVVALGQLLAVVRRRLGRKPSGRPEGTPAPADRRRVYAPHGSCVVLPRSYFARGGTLEHGAFMFGEEITVAETARRVGLPVLYAPELVVHHAEHRTTGWWRSREMLLWQRASVREIARLLDTRES